MKKFLTIFLISSVVSIAVFGIIAMSQMDEHGHGQCIASAAQGGLVPCPEDGAGSVISFHFSAFSKYSVAVVKKNFLPFALVLTALILLSLLGRLRRLTPAVTPGPMNTSTALHRLVATLSKEPFLNWLALRENSPAPYFGRQ